MVKPPQMLQRVAQAMQASGLVERALPSSKGNEPQGQLQTYRTEIFAYFTVVGGTQLLYSAENWVRIKIEPQTAGPIAVGTRASLTPVLGGGGITLSDGDSYQAYLAKGTRFYIASESVNRVNVTVEPVPWLEQLDKNQQAASEGLRAAIMSAASSIVAAIAALRSGAPAPSSGAPGHVDGRVTRAPSPSTEVRAPRRSPFPFSR